MEGGRCPCGPARQKGPFKHATQENKSPTQRLRLQTCAHNDRPLTEAPLHQHQAALPMSHFNAVWRELNPDSPGVQVLGHLEGKQRKKGDPSDQRQSIKGHQRLLLVQALLVQAHTLSHACLLRYACACLSGVEQGIPEVDL